MVAFKVPKRSKYQSVESTKTYFEVKLTRSTRANEDRLVLNDITSYDDTVEIQHLNLDIRFPLYSPNSIVQFCCWRLTHL